MNEKILVVEDDVAILTGLVALLSTEGYKISSARDGERAISTFKAEKPDLILLDIMIPQKNGYEVCKEIRRQNATVPIVMLTAKGQEVDKVVGLELGADDYIVKPFGVNELLARVRAVLRRSQNKTPKKQDTEPFVFRDISINPKTLTATKENDTFPLTLREIQLLQFFVEHPNEVVDRFTLLEEIWGIHYEGTTRTLDQHIAKLRQKIEDDPRQPTYILTVHGTGYRFSA